MLIGSHENKHYLPTPNIHSMEYLKLDWMDNINVWYKKGQSGLLLRRLDRRTQVLWGEVGTPEDLYDSVVVSAIFYGVACGATVCRQQTERD